MLHESPYRPSSSLARQSDTYERERKVHKHSAKSLFSEASIIREQYTERKGRWQAFFE